MANQPASIDTYAYAYAYSTPFGRWSNGADSYDCFYGPRRIGTIYRGVGGWSAVTEGRVLKGRHGRRFRDALAAMRAVNHHRLQAAAGRVGSLAPAMAGRSAILHRTGNLGVARDEIDDPRTTLGSFADGLAELYAALYSYGHNDGAEIVRGQILPPCRAALGAERGEALVEIVIDSLAYIDRGMRRKHLHAAPAVVSLYLPDHRMEELVCRLEAMRVACHVDGRGRGTREGSDAVAAVRDAVGAALAHGAKPNRLQAALDWWSALSGGPTIQVHAGGPPAA